MVTQEVKKSCRVELPLEVNHEIKLIQQGIERQDGTAPTIAELVVVLVQEALEVRREKQPA